MSSDAITGSLNKLLLMGFCWLALLSPASAEPLNWTTLDELDRYSRSYVKLDEEESVKDIRVALVRLSQKASPDQNDALFIFHRNSYFCGSGGCLLQVLLQQKDGTMKNVFEVNTDDVQLGKQFTKGMRNLRFNEAVTWVWTGSTYDIK